MSDVFPSFESRIEARREAAGESLKSITAEELTALGQKLFPDIDHPWQVPYETAIIAPNTTFFTGEVGDHIAFIYSPTKETGLWFRTEDPRGMGPIQERGLRVLADLTREL